MNELTLRKIINDISSICGPENVTAGESMSLHTTFRIGGPASVYVTPETEDETEKTLVYCAREGIEYFVTGKGSNLLVSDEGFDGVIINLSKNVTDMSVCRGNRIRAGAGVSLASVASLAAENSLSGFEFASGIPGTVGGAVIMNAGAYGGEICGVFEEATYLLKNAEGQYEKKTSSAEEVSFGYRTSYFKEKGAIILSAVFRLTKEEDSEPIYDLMKELARKRISKQPLNLPSAGSAFKRPQNGFAAAMIESCGLKGFSVGDAQVSEKHSGFIVNTGNATAADVCGLIRAVRKKVFEETGTLLEPEICFLGKDLM